MYKSSDFVPKVFVWVFLCQFSCLVSAPFDWQLPRPVFPPFSLRFVFRYNMCATTESRGIINGDPLVSKEGGCNEDAMRERSERTFLSGFLRRQLPLTGLLRTLPLREVTHLSGHLFFH